MAERRRPNYFVVWLWLVGLVTLSVVASLTLPKTAALSLIFAVAAVKSLLVLLNYMHLKFERALLYALAFVPLVVVVILLFALFPDLVFRR